MPFNNFVEIGRIALITRGPDRNKLCTIVNVIDSNWVQVDGPEALTGVSRQAIRLTDVALTKFTVRISVGQRNKLLTQIWKRDNILEQWNNTAWAKKLAVRSTRANATDFDKFKIMLAKKKRRDVVHKEFLKVKKSN